MTILTTFANGGDLKDYRDTFNSILGRLTTLEAGGSTVLPTVTLSAAQSHAEGNSGATLFTYTVSRSNSTGAISVPWSFAAGTTSAADYTGGTLPTGGTVAMASGVATGTITISVAGDTTVEPDETFTVLISAPSGYAAGAAMSATGTVLNDDTASFTPPTGYNAYGSTNTVMKAMLTRISGGTGRGKIAIMGDSTMAGYGSGSPDNLRQYSMGRLIAARLTSRGFTAADRSRVGDAGTGPYGYNAASYDPRATLGDFAYNTGGAARSWPGGEFFTTSGSSPFTLAETSVDTFNIATVGAPGTILIDGAAPASTTTASAAGFTITTVKDASVGSHTVSIATGTLMWIDAFDSTAKAINFWNNACGGAQSSDQAASGSGLHSLDGLGAFAPDLTIINCLLNDLNNNIDPSTSATAYGAMIDKAKLSGDVLVVFPYPALGGFANGRAAMKTAIQNVCSTKGVAYSDLDAYEGGTASASNFADSQVHGTPTYYGHIADALDLALQAMAA